MRKILTKTNILRAFALLLCCAFFLCSCSESGNDENTVSLPENQEPEVYDLTPERASELVKNDAEITDMFVNNSLFGGDPEKLEYYSVKGKYKDFEEIKKLLFSTYSNTDGVCDYFLKYPLEKMPSLKNDSGKTFAFYHPGSEFTDKIKTGSIKVSHTDEKKATIFGTTKNGKDIKLSAVFENGKWLLEKGLFLSAQRESYCANRFPMSDIGSAVGFSGKILIVELFLSDSETSFDSDDEIRFHKKIKEGTDRLVKESEKYGNKVEITYQNAYFKHEGVLGDYDYSLDMMFAATSFGTLENFVKTSFDLSLYDSYAIMVCRNSDTETKCNVFQKTSETSLYYAERIIIGNSVCPGEITKGLLQMFGAYGLADKDFCGTYYTKLYKIYFPDDIMLSDGRNDFSISPAAAFASGITHDLDYLYRVFRFSVNG